MERESGVKGRAEGEGRGGVQKHADSINHGCVLNGQMPEKVQRVRGRLDGENWEVRVLQLGSDLTVFLVLLGAHPIQFHFHKCINHKEDLCAGESWALGTYTNESKYFSLFIQSG